MRKRAHIALISSLLILLAWYWFVQAERTTAHPHLATEVGGDITTDTTWTKEESPYVIRSTQSVTVLPGVTLTIEPGVTIQASNNFDAPSMFRVQGTLMALGTPTDPITFTSTADTGPEQWAGLLFNGSNDGEGRGHLRHVTVRYSGRKSFLPNAFNVGALQAEEVIIENSRIVDESGSGTIGNNQIDHGLYVNNSTVVISNTLFANNGDTSRDHVVYATGPSTSLHLINASFAESNAVNRILIYDNARVVVDEVDTTSTDIVLAPQEGLEAFEFHQVRGVSKPYTIATSTTMRIRPGTMLKFKKDLDVSARLHIQGHLESLGTEEQPVVLTSNADSKGGQWVGVEFDGSEGEGSGYLRHTTIRHAGGGGNNAAVYAEDVQGNREVVLQNCTIHQSFREGVGNDVADYILYNNNSHMRVTNTVFSENGNSNKDFAVRSRGENARLLLSNSVLQQNYNGIKIDGGEATVFCSLIQENKTELGLSNSSANTVMAEQNWWGDASGPTHPDNPDGTGYAIEEGAGAVLFEPWLEEPICALSIYLPTIEK